MTKSSFIEKDEWASDVLDFVHTDVCGPMSISVRGGYHYFITFTDDLSRYWYIYLMKYKFKSFEMFKWFRNEIKNQTKKNIKTLRSDRGGEYLLMNFWYILRRMRFSINRHLLKCHNTIVCQKREIESYWIWFDPWWTFLVCRSFFEDMHSS